MNAYAYIWYITLFQYHLILAQSELFIYFISVRYPNDVYDRIWGPLLFDNWIPISTNSTVHSLSNDNAYNIPDGVLRTAAKTQNASIPLSLSLTPPDSLSKCYVYFHFAEIEKLENGQQRELTILLNGERYLTESVTLDYLNSRTILPTELAIMGERLNFSITAAEGSKFPPILNAVEIFVSKELPNKTTAIQDGMLSSLLYFPFYWLSLSLIRDFNCWFNKSSNLNLVMMVVSIIFIRGFSCLNGTF